MFALLLAASLLAPAPPDGTYSYTSTMNGAEIGKTSITLSRAANGDVVLSEAGSGNMNGQSGSVQDTLTLDAQLQPKTYSSLASIADSRNMKATISFDGGQARQTGDVNKVYDLPAGTKHFVLTDVGPFSGFFMLPAQMRAWRDEPVVALVPNFAQSVPLTLDAALRPDRPAGVPAADAQMSFTNLVQLTVWYNPRTLVVDRVDVPSEGLIVTRKGEV
jgi:hypothetical protein